MKTTEELLAQARATHGEGAAVTETWRGPEGEVLYVAYNQQGVAKITNEAFTLLASKAGFELVVVEIES